MFKKGDKVRVLELNEPRSTIFKEIEGEVCEVHASTQPGLVVVIHEKIKNHWLFYNHELAHV